MGRLLDAPPLTEGGPRRKFCSTCRTSTGADHVPDSDECITIMEERRQSLKDD